MWNESTREVQSNCSVRREKPGPRNRLVIGFLATLEVSLQSKEVVLEHVVRKILTGLTGSRFQN